MLGPHLLSTKGTQFLRTLFIVIEAANKSWRVTIFKNLCDIASDEPNFLFVIDDDAKVRPERAIVYFLYVIPTFVPLSL